MTPGLSAADRAKLEAHIQSLGPLTCTACGAGNWLAVGPFALQLHMPPPTVITAAVPAPAVCALFLAMACRSCSFTRWLLWPPLEPEGPGEVIGKKKPFDVIEGGAPVPA